jgi:hypothetical protein
MGNTSVIFTCYCILREPTKGFVECHKSRLKLTVSLQSTFNVFLLFYVHKLNIFYFELARVCELDRDRDREGMSE